MPLIGPDAWSGVFIGYVVFCCGLSFGSQGLEEHVTGAAMAVARVACRSVRGLVHAVPKVEQRRGIATCKHVRGKPVYGMSAIFCADVVNVAATWCVLKLAHAPSSSRRPRKSATVKVAIGHTATGQIAHRV